MANNEIKIQFVGDDSSLNRSIEHVEQSISSIGRTSSQGGRSAWMNPEMVEFARRVKDAKDAGRDALINIAGNLKSARGEAESLKSSLGPIGNQLSGMAIGAVGFSSAMKIASDAGQILKYTLSQGLAVETSKFQAKTIFGDTSDWKEFQKIAKDTSTDVTKVAKTAEELYVTGASRSQADQMAYQISARAKVLGDNPEELANIIGRIQTHGEVTFRELTRLAMLSGGATRDLAIQYRDLDKNVQETTMSMERQRLQQQQAYTEQSRTREATNDVLGKLGLTEAPFQRWLSSPWNAKRANDPFGNKMIDQFQQGLSEMSQETGIDQRWLWRYGVQSGKIGESDLISYAGKQQQRLQQEQTFAQEKARQDLTQSAYYQKQDIAQQIVAAFMQPGDVQEQLDAFKQTPVGKIDAFKGAFVAAHQAAGETAINNPLRAAIGTASLISGASNMIFNPGAGIIEMFRGFKTLTDDRETAAKDAAEAPKNLSDIKANTKKMADLLEKATTASGGGS